MFVLAIGALGLLIGPLLASVIASVPDRSGGGRSFLTCPTCGAGQPVSVLVPVVGSLRACAVCGQVSDRTIAAVTVLSTSLFTVVGLVVGQTWVLLPLLLLVAALIALSVVDIQRFRLPDKLLFPSFALCALAILLVSLFADATEHLVPAIVGAIAYFVMLLVPNLVSPAGLAFGDVKLALLLGLFLGWMRDTVVEGIVLVIYALILGMVLGIVSGLLVGIGRRVIGPDFLADPDFPPDDSGAKMPITKTAFPFGPALALSAIGVVLTSSDLLGTPGLLS